jgi:DNA replication protein DnaC
VIYREAHILLEEIAEAAMDGKRKEHMELLATVPLLIIDDLGMRKLGPAAGESCWRSSCVVMNELAHS